MLRRRRGEFKVEADVSREQKEEIIEMGQKYSPVINSITKSALVRLALKT